MNQTLVEYFKEIESELEPMDEHVLAEKIGVILDAKNKKIENKEDLAEHIAFNFIPHYSNKETGWGTYYGPFFVLPNGRGQMVEFPSIQQIDQEIINHWKNRSETCKHPILVNRYADLVVDFEPRILNNKLNFSMAQKTIDSAIEICEKKLDDGLGSQDKLRRALTLALQINDNQRIDKLKKVIIETENKYAEDEKPGLWGYAFRWLVLDNSNKIKLTSQEENDLVTHLESRLTRLMSVEDPDPWKIENILALLAPYYSTNIDATNLERIIGNFESACRKNKYANSDGMLVSNYLEKLIDIYLTYSKFQFAKDGRIRIVNELNNLGKKAKFGMNTISTEIMITNDEKSQFLNGIFGENSEYSLEKIIVNLANNFILRKKTVVDQLSDLSKNHPILYLMGHVMASEDGYPIVKFGSLEEDYDKHLLENFSQNLHFGAIFLRFAFDKLKDLHTPEDVVDILFMSPVFCSDDKNYILKLFRALWNKDYLTTSCLSIPLIEDSVRNLYKVNNETYIKTNDLGGYDVYSLKQLLEKGLVKVVFRHIGEDVEYYFRVLMTERVGWNLRNNFAHGINIRSFENEDVANRLIHVLFCLSLVRRAEEVKKISDVGHKTISP